MPSKSQIALALYNARKSASLCSSTWRQSKTGDGASPIRRRINLIQEATAVLLGKDTSEAPRLVLEGLNIHDLYKQDIAWLRALDLEGAGEVVDLCEVDVLDVVG